MYSEFRVRKEMGSRSRTIVDAVSTTVEIGVIGVPFAGGQRRGGVDQGTKALRDSGLLADLRKGGYTVIDAGDVDTAFDSTTAPEDSDFRLLKHPRWCGQVNKRVYDAVRAQGLDGRVALTLGGDHSLAAGSIAGSASVHEDLAVLWIDAHADINTVDTTVSGNIHGMPVSWIAGLSQERNVPGWDWYPSTRVISPDRIAYIGLRDLDTGEKDTIKRLGIKTFTMHDIDRFGIAKVVESALSHIDPYARRPLHLSFDIDGLDPSEAPATGTAVRGGLTFREGCYICEEVASTNRLVSMDLVEVNPALAKHDGDLEKTLSAATSMIRCAFGESLI